MEIRRATLADIPAVCTCCVAAFKDYIPLIGRTPALCWRITARPWRTTTCLWLRQRKGSWATCSSRRGGGLHVDGRAGGPPKGNRRGPEAHGLLRGIHPGPREGECRLYTHVKYKRTQEIYLRRGYEIYDRVKEKGFERFYMRRQLK